MEFKEKLKMLRKEKGISQQQLADRIFVSRSAVAKWENGLGYPSEDSYDALTAYFEVDNRYFHTEEPETVIVSKNRHIRLLRFIAALVAVAAAIAAITVGFHWFSSVPKDSIQGIAHQAAAYLGYGDLDVVKVSQRGDYLAALCEDKSGNWCMCEFDRDPLFSSRWRANGGKGFLSPGEIGSWNYGNPRDDAVLIFCGGMLPEEIHWYTFTNSGIEYTCPVENRTVLDIFIIPDSGDINSYPVPLDSQRQPVIPEVP